MNDMSVDIGQLGLEGFTDRPRNSAQLGALTASALQRLLAQQGPMLLAARHVAELRAPDISLPPGATEAQIAEAVALALWRVLATRGL